jgi:hypothetical protein
MPSDTPPAPRFPTTPCGPHAEEDVAPEIVAKYVGRKARDMRAKETD